MAGSDSAIPQQPFMARPKSVMSTYPMGTPSRSVWITLHPACGCRMVKGMHELHPVEREDAVTKLGPVCHVKMEQKIVILLQIHRLNDKMALYKLQK